MGLYLIRIIYINPGLEHFVPPTEFLGAGQVAIFMSTCNGLHWRVLERVGELGAMFLIQHVISLWVIGSQSGTSRQSLQGKSYKHFFGNFPPIMVHGEIDSLAVAHKGVEGNSSHKSMPWTMCLWVENPHCLQWKAVTNNQGRCGKVEHIAIRCCCPGFQELKQ